VINNFRGENDFLSNFHILQNPIHFGNLIFKTSEHFFAAHKSLIYEERVWIASLPEAREAKWAGSPKGYKGRKIHLREDWDDDDVKWSVMYLALMMKYTSNYNLAAKLMNTAPQQLVEGNRWHDNYWGDCFCDGCSHKEGKNILGLMHMHIRDKFFQIRI